MSEPELARIGHVALETADLDASLAFFVDAVGFEEVEREDGTVYLRAVDEFDHHSVSLTEAERAGVDHIGWQTRNPEDLEAYAELLETEEGLDVTWVDAGEEAGQGEAIRFSTPHGHPFEFYHEMEKPDPPAERRSKLKNKTYSRTTTNAVAPRRIDHVQIWDADAPGCAEWLQETLDFRVQEYYDREDGSRWGTFVSANGNKIEAAVIDDEAEQPPGLHHIAYKVDSADDLFDAADAMNERGVPTDGIGQHSISRGKFLYTRDEESGHRIEFNAGGYLVFDPNWEPIAWQEGDLDDRQWIGQIESTDRVQY